MVYTLFFGPGAADLGVLVCSHGKLQVSLRAVDIAQDGSCTLADGEAIRELELTNLALGYDEHDDGVFAVKLTANYREKKRRGSLEIFYDEVGRVGLLKREKPKKGDVIPYAWPNDFLKKDKRRERFLTTLCEIGTQMREAKSV